MTVSRSETENVQISLRQTVGLEGRKEGRKLSKMNGVLSKEHIRQLKGSPGGQRQNNQTKMYNYSAND